MADKPDPTCAYCGKTGTLARDHVVPRARGGPDNATNIVMACQACNSSKGDRLPSEWLGDRCPAAVLLIEIRMHTRLKKAFSYRDRSVAGTTPKLYGFAVNADGHTTYVGEVVAEAPGRVRLAVIDALSFACGLWDQGSELRDVRRSRVRLFTDRDECAEQASRNCKPWAGRA